MMILIEEREQLGCAKMLGLDQIYIIVHKWITFQLLVANI